MKKIPFDSLDIKAFSGVTADSRAVKRGYLFTALPGAASDGTRYIEDAVRGGALGILAGVGVPMPQIMGSDDVVFVQVQNPRRALALLAAEFYEAQPEHIVAVTGTNGKTSVVNFVRQLWENAGIRAASLGTLGVHAPGAQQAGALTTPDPVSLHAQLADLAAAEITHLALEASSHGLDQYRLDGTEIVVAGFTNLSRDHLDYHADMQNYLSCKARLFSEVMCEQGISILNADSDVFEDLKVAVRGDVWSYGRAGQELKLLEISVKPDGQDMALEVFGKRYDVYLPLVGGFQVENVLCALGVVLAGAKQRDYQGYIEALENLQGAPGRLQLVAGHPSGAAIYIDYAHTPGALETVLGALRAHTENTLQCLFGCGGSRDRGKRPMMGEVAQDHADLVFVTDDNPRSENPAAIRSDILAAAPDAIEIAGRAKAIAQAVKGLGAGDVLLVAGKGHEQGQIFENHTEPFDDYQAVKKAIEELVSK